MAEQKQAEPKQPEHPKSEGIFVRDPEDFEVLYANNVQAEASVWDLKLIFGIVDQSSDPHKVIQHTSINLPWIQVKILSYFIRANLLIHESQNGRVTIPASVVPPDPDKLDLSLLTSELRESLSKLHKEFLAAV